MFSPSLNSFVNGHDISGHFATGLRPYTDLHATVAGKNLFHAPYRGRAIDGAAATRATAAASEADASLSRNRKSVSANDKNPSSLAAAAAGET